MFWFCLVFAMSLCASVYLCFVVTCWERADILALLWYLIVSIPDLCFLTYFGSFVVFHGIRTSITKKPYMFCVFKRGVRTPSPPPSGSAHVSACKQARFRHSCSQSNISVRANYKRDIA